MKRKIYLVLSLGLWYFSANAQSQVITTGNNVIDTANPYAADVTIGSDANGGTRHNSSIMFWSNNSASRIFGANDFFYFSVWNSLNPNVGLAAGYGGSSYFQGNLGIGMMTPQDRLDVKEVFRLSGLNRNWRIMSHISDGSLYFRDETATAMVMTLAAGGNVGIGTISPQERLSVNGRILAREVKVTTDAANWPDFVFSPEYKITSLSDLETFIKANKHLPGVPSAREVAENGIELGEMNKQLLKKIEELTLIVIQQSKDITLLKEKVKTP